MPCWFFDKSELLRTPSYLDGITPETEARYRREGARFIIDAGTKLGLSYDTCATGVVYYHRFYMIHSFKEFHRYVMGACCLFLSGKVEETPKKCKDIIRIAKSMLTEQQFSVFSEDPREELMTLERCLLQTLKFDLQVDHPYSFLLKYAKSLKGDKQKIQKIVQMGWTFINDSLCTTLCLQWEAEITATALMYLASRLSKYEITDWVGKLPGVKTKWYEHLIEGITMELLEDVCHQVLDLYSSKPHGDSPKSNEGKEEVKKNASPLTVSKDSASRSKQPENIPAPPRDEAKRTSTQPVPPSVPPQGPGGDHPPTPAVSQMDYTSAYSAYMPHQMSSSFMSQEGVQNIQNIMGGGYTQAGYAPHYPTSVAASNQTTANPASYPYQQAGYAQPQYTQQAYPAHPTYAQPLGQPGYPAPPQNYQVPTTGQPYPGAYPAQPSQPSYQEYGGYPTPTEPPPPKGYKGGPPQGNPRGQGPPQHDSALTVVRITGRTDGRR